MKLRRGGYVKWCDIPKQNFGLLRGCARLPRLTWEYETILQPDSRKSFWEHVPGDFRGFGLQVPVYGVTVKGVGFVWMG